MGLLFIIQGRTAKLRWTWEDFSGAISGNFVLFLSVKSKVWLCNKRKCLLRQLPRYVDLQEWERSQSALVPVSKSRAWVKVIQSYFSVWLMRAILICVCTYDLFVYVISFICERLCRHRLFIFLVQRNFSCSFWTLKITDPKTWGGRCSGFTRRFPSKGNLPTLGGNLPACSIAATSCAADAALYCN